MENENIETEQNEINEQQTEQQVETKPQLDNVPEKFIKDGEIQYDQILKSYNELEKKFYSTPKEDENTPQPIDPETGYDLDMGEINLERNQEFETQMIQQGFTNEQAQSVYKFASDYLGEEFERIGEMKKQVMEDELANHFGGNDKWNKIKDDLSNWASVNLNDETFNSLSRDVKGIKSLYSMMQSSREFSLSDNGQTNKLTQENLYQMMDNPKYWRDRDPEYIAQVEAGFKQLYGDEKVEV